jgi:hypothetical protein
MGNTQVLELGLRMGEVFLLFSLFSFYEFGKVGIFEANLEYKYVSAKFGQIYDISYINLVTTWFFFFFLFFKIRQLGLLVMIPNIN